MYLAIFEDLFSNWHDFEPKLKYTIASAFVVDAQIRKHIIDIWSLWLIFLYKENDCTRSKELSAIA